jgi:hypothetical protein
VAAQLAEHVGATLVVRPRDGGGTVARLDFPAETAAGAAGVSPQ